MKESLAFKFIQTIGASTMTCKGTGHYTLPFDAAKAAALAAIGFMQEEMGMATEMDEFQQQVENIHTPTSDFTNPQVREAKQLLKDIRLFVETGQELDERIMGRVSKFIAKN